MHGKGVWIGGGNKVGSKLKGGREDKCKFVNHDPICYDKISKT